jgi:hypothetical protein
MTTENTNPTTTTSAPGPTLRQALGKSPTLAESKTFTAAAIPLHHNTSEVPREICGELLRAGERAVLGSTSKSGKSWALLHLAIAKASGLPWLGWPMKAGPVLYLDLELLPFFFQKRVSTVCSALNVVRPENLHLWSIRAVRPKPNMDELVSEIVSRFKDSAPDLVILEPSYKLVTPTTQGTNSEMKVLEYLELLDQLTNELNCAGITSHHSPKGDLSQRSSMDLFSGTGVWARDPDLLMTLRPHKEDGHTILDFTRRHGPPVDGQVLKWDYPLHYQTTDLDARDVGKPGQRSGENLDRIMNALDAAPVGGFTNKEWLRAALAGGLSEATFYRMKTAAQVKQLWVAVMGPDKRSRFMTKAAAGAAGDQLNLTVSEVTV